MAKLGKRKLDLILLTVGTLVFLLLRAACYFFLPENRTLPGVLVASALLFDSFMIFRATLLRRSQP